MKPTRVAMLILPTSHHVSAWMAMERFKIGVIPTLAACAVLGIVIKIVGWA
jgi:hypothetical protein